MATYTELVARIEVATEELEADVLALNDFVDSSSGVVADALDEAAQRVQEASTYAQEAQLAKEQSQAIKDSIATIAPVGEAPNDGSVYGRKDSEWVQVEAGTGGGGGVASVNGVLPDESGDVVIEIPTNTSTLNNDSGFITDAPTDGTEYVRKDATWVAAPTGGGGDAGGGYTNSGVVKLTEAITYTFYTNKKLHDAYNAPIGSDEYTWFTDANAPEEGEGDDTQFWLGLQAGWVEDGSIPLSNNPFHIADLNTLKAVRSEVGEDDVEYTPEIEYGYSASVGDFAWEIKGYGTQILELVLDVTPEALEFRNVMLEGVWSFKMPLKWALDYAAAGLPETLINKGAYLKVIKASGSVPKREYVLTVPDADVGTRVWYWSHTSNKWVADVRPPI